MSRQAKTACRACRAGPAALIVVASLLSASMTGCANRIATPANRYALVIGLGTNNGGVTCRNADYDADDMGSLLGTTGWTSVTRLISSSNGTIATALQPTYDNIRAAVSTLAREVGSDSSATILVYYSGHGLESNGYLVPYDATSGGAVTAPEKLISPATLSSWLGAAGCRNKILILDSCYSGNFVDSGSAVDTSPQDSNTATGTTETGLLVAAISNLNSLIAASIEREGDPSVMTISAAGSEEQSYSGTSAWSNGVFTTFLLDSATHGDTDNDGYVTTTEAYTYAKAGIATYWNPMYLVYGYALLPHISGGSGDLVLFVNQ
jgi:hypothetical protein